MRSLRTVNSGSCVHVLSVLFPSPFTTRCFMVYLLLIFQILSFLFLAKTMLLIGAMGTLLPSNLTCHLYSISLVDKFFAICLIYIYLFLYGIFLFIFYGCLVVCYPDVEVNPGTQILITVVAGLFGIKCFGAKLFWC